MILKTVLTKVLLVMPCMEGSVSKYFAIKIIRVRKVVHYSGYPD